MNNFTWGATDLNVIDGSYIPPHKKVNIEEIKTIPALDNLLPNSILQMGGRDRIEVTLQGIVYNFAEMNALSDDDVSKTIRTFTDAYGLSLSMIIKEFKLGNWKHGQVFEYTLTLMEA